MEDYLEDEMKIMDEQGTEHCISSDVFYNPISSLKLDKVISLSQNDSLSKAISYFKNEGASAVVITENERLIGILTERDIILRAVGVVTDYEKALIKDYMTNEPVSLKKEDSMVYIFHNMHVGSFRHIPIVDDDLKPINIVSVRDAVSFILEFFPEEIDNISDFPFRGERNREGA